MAKAQAQAPLQQNTTQKWKYKGVSLDGSKQMKGTIEANSRDQAVARITQMGAHPHRTGEPLRRHRSQY